MVSKIVMHTRHRIYLSDSRHMKAVADESIDLIVTSPPYPMIEMWDLVFARQDAGIQAALKERRDHAAFEGMHRILDGVWKEAFRVLKKGGMACINIGDAVRTLRGRFALYPNHARILAGLQRAGFTPLPCILWRKQTNAPTKFMGSGMLPPGAYVTLEHEYILVFRKGPVREFKTDSEKKRRRESAFFWEERNIWFSDVWMDLKGTSQPLFDETLRRRSGAFPLELAYRLIAMFSVREDTVLDPFFGVGTTLAAAMALARHSVGYEIDPNFEKAVDSQAETVKSRGNQRALERLQNHLRFVENRLQAGKSLKHRNAYYGFPVMTRQETELVLSEIVSLKKAAGKSFEATHKEMAREHAEVKEKPASPHAHEKDPSVRGSSQDRRRQPVQGRLFSE
jgi:DNA modification methylase